MNGDLPPFLQDLLASPPRAGEGVHGYLFRVARQLHAHLPAVEIVRLLENKIANCGRSVPRNEIVAAVQNSIGCAWQFSGSSSAFKPAAISRWPEKNLEHIEATCAEGYGLADLWEMSPIRIEDSNPHTEEIIDHLFPGDPLLCCGWSDHRFATKHRQEWRGQLGDLQFIVPSPMTKVWGKTKDGKDSQHTLDATGPRRFLVVECDFSIYAPDGKTETKVTPLIQKLASQGFSVSDICAAVLLHLAQFAPLVCAVHSGGKSTHGWFYVNNEGEEKLLRFMRYAVSLGADSLLWTRSQFVRMPDGTRDNGKRQTVYFLHFKPLEFDADEAART